MSFNLNLTTPKPKTRKRTAKPKGPTESAIQQTFVQWFHLQYPKFRFVSYAIPNGGERTGRYGARLVAEGLLKGVPDWHLAVSRGGYASLYLEFKSATGKLTEAQEAVIPELRIHGHLVEVVKSFDAAKAVVEYYLRME